MKQKLLHGFVFLLALTGFLLSTPVTAQAASSSEIRQYIIDNNICDVENNPASCNCKYFFSNDSGEIEYVAQGGTDLNDLGHSLIAVPRNYPLNWQVFVYEPNNDDREINCHTEQYLASDALDPIEIRESWKDNCDTSDFVTSWVTCPTATFSLTDDIFSNITTGFWDSLARNDMKCGDYSMNDGWYPTDWTVSPQRSHLSGEYEFGRLNRLDFVGEKTGIIGEAPDKHYCGLLITKGTTNEISDDVSEDLIETDFSLCNQIDGDKSPTAQNFCAQCLMDQGIWTALGCIPTRPQSMISTLMGIGLSMAGGVCILMILAAGFTLSSSRGDVNKTGKAKEMLTSAIVGLLFIIFSVTILQFIGVSILRIPGFGGN